MRGNVTSTMRAGLPPGWTAADKTGTGDYGSTNDVGIAEVACSVLPWLLGEG